MVRRIVSKCVIPSNISGGKYELLPDQIAFLMLKKILGFYFGFKMVNNIIGSLYDQYRLRDDL